MGHKYDRTGNVSGIVPEFFTYTTFRKDFGRVYIDSGDATGKTLILEEIPTLLLPIVAAVTDVDIPTKTFKADGDLTSYLYDGASFIIKGSTGNDGTYTINGTPTYAGGPDETTIIVDQTIPDATIDGNVHIDILKSENFVGVEVFVALKKTAFISRSIEPLDFSWDGVNNKLSIVSGTYKWNTDATFFNIIVEALPRTIVVDTELTLDGATLNIDNLMSFAIDPTDIATVQFAKLNTDYEVETDLQKLGTVAINVNGGVKDGGTQTVTLATDDPAVTALEIMDDWDESDRAKVNPIAGQAGVAAGAGAVDALTQRTTLASDDPAVVLLTSIAGVSAPGTGYYATEDPSFVAGDSPVILDINAALSRNAQIGFITCDGAGSILVELDEAGVPSWGTQFTLKNGESLDLESLNVDQIRITHSGTDSAYRILAK